MNLHIHIHHHGDDKLFTEIKSINTKLSTMADEIQELQQQVERDTTVTQSAVTLLNGLKAKLDEALSSGNMEIIRQLSTDIASNTDALAAAVTANTPSEDEPGTGEPGAPNA